MKIQNHKECNLENIRNEIDKSQGMLKNIIETKLCFLKITNKELLMTKLKVI